MYNHIKKENERYDRKVFLLEQELFKKQNEIHVLQSKLSLIHNTFNNKREVYILDPSKAIIEINSELVLYRNFFAQILKNAEQKENTIKKYNKLITHLKEENANLKVQCKEIIKSANRDNTDETIDNLGSNNGNHVRTNSQNNLTPQTMGISVVDPKFEFNELLHSCGLTKVEFEQFRKNKRHSKLIEAIEMCYNIISDKNIQINLLEVENDKLNIKNFEVNKENMLLLDEHRKLNTTSLNNRNTDDDSLSNNTSQFTSANNRSVNLSSLTTYHKMLEQRQNKPSSYSCTKYDNNNHTVSQMIKKVIYKKPTTMNTSVESIKYLEFKKDIMNTSVNLLDDNNKAMILDNLNGIEEQQVHSRNSSSFISQTSLEFKKELGL